MQAWLRAFFGISALLLTTVAVAQAPDAGLARRLAIESASGATAVEAAQRRSKLHSANAEPERRQQKIFGVPDGCNGDVNALVVAPSGLLYLGGRFSACEDVLAAGVASYDPRTRRFAALGSASANGVDLWVQALAMVGNDLYVGGFFTRAGGQPAANIARWNGTAWSALGAGTNQIIEAIAAIGTDVYVAGQFTVAGNQPASRIARWNGSAWSTLGTGATNGIDCCGVVLAAQGSDLIVGGSFSTAGGLPAAHIARWNGSSWSALGSGVTGESVRAIARDGNDLIVGGRFTAAGGQPAGYIARWNGSSWSTLGSGVNETVEAIAVVGNLVYAGGRFDRAGGALANTIARWNGSSWSALADADGNAIPIGGFTFALALLGPDLYVGGSHSRAGNQAANRIARWDGTAWNSLGSGVGNGVNSDIYALIADSSNLVVAGRFTEAGGESANRIARWNGSRWFTLGDGPGNGLNSVVFALAGAPSGVLYAGGGFIAAGGVEANHIARWNGTSWSALGSGLENVGAYAVSAIALSGNDVYAAGDFQIAGGASANRIARWNGSAWSALGSGIGSADGDRVQALAVIGSDVYAAGRFASAGGQPANAIARWNGSGWSALGSGLGWTQSSEIVTVHALVVVGTDLYVGGEFNLAGGAAANNVARWNGSSWSALGSGSGNGLNSSVYALTATATAVVAGGLFDRAAGQPAGGLASFNGNSWTGLATGGPRQLPRALATDGISLYAGGSGLTQTPLPELQTRSLDGGAANGASEAAVVSTSGARVAFTSQASNLTPADNNGRRDVFVRDLLSGTTTRASQVAETFPGGAQESFADPALSGDGRGVAFSGSSGQVYAAIDGVGRQLSSNAAGAAGNGVSARPFLTGGAELAIFDSLATNLLPGVDGNGALADIYSKNLATGAVGLVSLGPNGEPANGPSSSPWASRDGLVVAFQTRADNLVAESAPATGKGTAAQQALMMRGAGFGQTRLYLSRNPASGQLGNGDSGNVRITPDGRYGVFESVASNLVDGDTNAVADVFRFEIVNNQLGRLERVSVSTYGAQGNGPSKNASIADDGSYVSFETDASNLVELDRNNTTDVLVKWMVSGEVLRLSRTVDGNQPNGASSRPSMSGDGSSIVFASLASNLATGDSNASQDVFSVRLRGLAPVNPTGAWYDPAQDGHGLQLQLLGDGRMLAFWYTFDPAGNLTYFIGDGPFDGNAATLTNVRPVGTFFPPNFNTSQVSLQPFGTLRLSFESCTRGRVEFDLPQGFGQGSMQLTRLTQPVGIACGTTPTTTANGPMAAASGAWYDPATDGQGLLLESLAGGVLLATWYSYGPSPAGGQAWMTGVGSINGNSATLSIIKVAGGRFIPNFNPALITRPVLGTATIMLSNCNTGSVSYSFNQGFGNGNLALTRLTTPAGVRCTEN